MSTEQCITIVQAHKLACRIYVGSLNYDLRPADMKQLFSTVGPVTMGDMNVDYATGRNKVNSNARACLLALLCAVVVRSEAMEPADPASSRNSRSIGDGAEPSPQGNRACP